MRNRRREEDPGFIEKTIAINRVSKVVKGGRRFNFTAIVVSGDGEGRVGVGYGKANEVPEAIRKATEKARKSQISVPIVDGTVPHTVEGHFGAANVLLRPASPGTGVIAAASVRAILDAAGYHNVLTKVLGTNNPHNVVRGVFDALQRLESPEQYAVRTGRKVEDLLGDYNVGASVWGTSA
ncbi:MAG: 30S ribosomal protein S5 [Alphaproteobacteria bacterium]|nr:30S ribosomal protein S5 [Alphaproteobacteria bacterium]